METAPPKSNLQDNCRKAKKIYLYRNGNGQDVAKMMVINDRVVRDFPTLLTYATLGLKAPVAIRNLYTPVNGHRVGNLGELQDDQMYVAAGQERFKKLRYGNAPRLLPRRRQATDFVVPSRTGQAVVASARYKKPPMLKPLHIHVFRNGDEKYHGAKVLLTQRTLYSLDHVLELIMEKTELFTPASRLCTLEGVPIRAVSELEDGKQYVVIEGSKPFKKARYSTVDPLLESPTNKKRWSMAPRPAVKLQLNKLNFTVPHPPPRERKLSRKERPMGGRKDKEKREKALKDHRADSVFGTSSRKHRSNLIASQLFHPEPDHVPAPPNVPAATQPTAESPLVESTSKFHAPQNTDASIAGQNSADSYVAETADGVFKPREDSLELQNAEDVREAHDIEIERPLDHEQAQEVEEAPNDTSATSQPKVDADVKSSTPNQQIPPAPSSLHSNSGQGQFSSAPSPAKQLTSRTSNRSKLSNKSVDSLTGTGRNSRTREAKGGGTPHSVVADTVTPRNMATESRGAANSKNGNVTPRSVVAEGSREAAGSKSSHKTVGSKDNDTPTPQHDET